MDNSTRSGGQTWELCAARLALLRDSADEGARHPGSEDLAGAGQTLVDFFERNGFPLLGLPGSSPLFQVSELRCARAEQALEYGRLRAEFEIVRRAWENEGIECLALKSVGSPPDFPYKSGNLDVLISPGRGALARGLLGQLGFVEVRNCEEPNKFLFRRFRGGVAACDIHLHLRIEWRVSFLFEDEVWDRRQRSTDEPSLFVPSPEDALLINVAHFFFENKSVTLWDLRKIQHCLRRPGLDWAYVWKVANTKGWHTGLASALLIHNHLLCLLMGSSSLVQSQIERARQQLGGVSSRTLGRLFSKPYSLPFPIGFSFSKELFVQKILADRGEGWGDKLGDLLLHFATGTKLKLGLRSQPGFLIALSGVDGAGKTTQARFLSRAMNRCGIRTKYVWSRPGSSFLSSQLLKMASFSTFGRGRNLSGTAECEPTDSSGSGNDGPAFNPHSWLHRTAWLCLVLLDCVIAFGVRVRLSLLAGRVVICDRYLPDAFADLANRFKDEKAANHLLLRLVAGICPRADFPVLLRVDAEQARRRKESHSKRPAPELERSQARLLDTFAERGHFAILDASRDPESVSDVLVFRSLTRYFARFRTLVNAIFFANPRSTPDRRETTGTLPDRPSPMTRQESTREEHA